MEYKKGVIDRIEDGRIAVIFLEDDLKRYDLPVSLLPAEAREGDWLRLTISDDKVIKIEINKDETDKRRKRITEKFLRLRKKK
ncbi:MAG TPA: DUF3006 domain-containing protein [Caldisericia bacterium]|nr:DUF3006 domain-containing protein [Caldisericia bacterium]HOW02661.1 DUF3006 domain-containing protein [Caldisericia bacterium]HPO28627.1 DUF3006 domain-containing protein [Caldisericia bacterium]HXK70008.1 DUF3006 domain-containing protein [Caldisericia bacterium]